MDIICFPGTPDSLGEIRSFIRNAMEQARVDKKRIYHLQLAVDEIASNIVIYGYKDGLIRGDIEVEIVEDPTRIVVTLKDTSPAFDPLRVKMPDNSDLQQPLEDRSIGGLGIYLAIKNVDEFRYMYADGKNHNMFILNNTKVDLKDHGD